MDMSLDIRRSHALGIHGQDLFFNVLTDAGLVLLQNLRLKFALAIPRYGYLNVTEAGAQIFAAVPVAAVVGLLVFVVVLAVSQLVIQLRIKTVLHKLGNGFLEQILDVVHAADAAHLQQLTDLGSALVFFRRAILSRHSKSSIMVLLFYTIMEVYTIFGMDSRAKES